MPTHFKGSLKTIRSLNAFINLMRASESVIGRLQKRLSAEGLTASQFGALETLLHLGPLCQTELGKKLLKTDGNVTMVVNHLEKRGLVKRVRAGEDRRFVSVHLTPKGRALIQTIFPRHAGAIQEEMSVLSVSEQEKLRNLCRKLGRKNKMIKKEIIK